MGGARCLPPPLLLLLLRRLFGCGGRGGWRVSFAVAPAGGCGAGLGVFLAGVLVFFSLATAFGLLAGPSLRIGVRVGSTGRLPGLVGFPPLGFLSLE